ncbi:unnamed protein product, partial [Leptidea sinapis]
ALTNTKPPKQERATIDYVNPKYLSHAHILTVRKSRDSAYTSTITMTTLKTFGNNVTGTYALMNFEIPPRDFPIPVPEGVSKGHAYFLTGKELIGSGTIILRDKI